MDVNSGSVMMVTAVSTAPQRAIFTKAQFSSCRKLKNELSLCSNLSYALPSLPSMFPVAVNPLSNVHVDLAIYNIYVHVNANLSSR